MNKNCVLAAVATAAALLMTSCKGEEQKVPAQNAASEAVQEQKAALADSVVAKLEALAGKYIDAADSTPLFAFAKLSNEEKMVKPDYLLDPAEASKFITKKQKVNGLAIYSVEYFVRKMFGMPVNEVKEAIAKLSIDVNHPIEVEATINWDDGLSKEKVKRIYDLCKERGELTYFWQYENAVVREIDFLLAKNPNFFGKISEKEWQGHLAQWRAVKEALGALAEFDEEMRQAAELVNINKDMDDESFISKYFADIKTAAETYKQDIFQFIRSRTLLIQ